MQEAAPLKDYRTSLEVKADDLFDLVKSDSTLLDPYLAASWQWDFNSSCCLPPQNHILPSSSPVFSPFHPSLCLGFLNLPTHPFPFSKRLLWEEVKGVFSAVRTVFKGPSHCSSPSSCLLSSPNHPLYAFMLYICICGEWQRELRKRWMVGGWLSATETGTDP